MKHIQFFATVTNEKEKSKLNEMINSSNEEDVDKSFHISVENIDHENETSHYTLRGSWAAYRMISDSIKHNKLQASLEHFEEV